MFMHKNSLKLVIYLRFCHNLMKMEKKQHSKGGFISEGISGPVPEKSSIPYFVLNLIMLWNILLYRRCSAVKNIT